jgi:hypothetical protein
MATLETCFVISQVGKADSQDRVHADQVFNHIISPATSALDIATQRADHIEETGSISSQILERLLSSDVVIADLSKRNPNVYYELAIRHVVRKPCIHLINESEEIPFDVQALRAIPYDLANPDSVSRARDSLERYLKNLTAYVASPFGSEFAEKLEEYVVSGGCKGYARVAVRYPPELREILQNPFIPNTSFFMRLSTDYNNLLLLQSHLSSTQKYTEIALESWIKQRADKEDKSS